MFGAYRVRDCERHRAQTDLVRTVVAVGGWVGVTVRRGWRGIAVDDVRMHDDRSLLLDDGWRGCLGLDYNYRWVLLLGIVGLRRRRVGLLDRRRIDLLNGRRGWIGIVVAGDHLRLMLDLRFGGDAYVVEEFDGETGLGFEDWSGSTTGKVDEIDGPENGDEPFDGVAGGVPGSEDSTVGVDSIFAGVCDDTGRDRDDGVIANDDAVELELHPAFADEVSRVFIVFEVTYEVATVGEDGAAVDLDVA